MNEHSNVKSLMAHNLSCYLARHSIKAMVAVLGFAVFIGGPVYAADPVNTKTAAKGRVVPISTEIAPRMEFSPGQSHLIRMPVGVSLQKVKVEDDKIVQVEVTSPREIVLHAKGVGFTSLMIWDKSGQVTIMDVSVTGNTVAMDATALQGKLQQMLPNEKGIVVGTAGKSLVLSGNVRDAVKVDKAMTLAEAYAGKDNKVINMLQVDAPQQVMLEVKMAEISKNLLDQLGVAFNFSRANGNVAYSLLKGFGLADLGGKITFTNGQTNVTIDAEKKDTLIKVLAEPNIIAISGQEGSFLAGGKFYIPVPQAGVAAGAVTLEEKDFGVGLRFTPTVLEDGLINLRVAPEVTELLSTTIQVGVGNSPTLSTRRVATTVQLRDGQSFAIAGLLKSSVNADVKRFPILGEIPILGALFRSSAFKNDKTELLFVVTPRLVKPLPPDYALPTDDYTPPSRVDFFLKGKLEGKPAAPAAVPEAPPADTGTPAPAEQGANDGFEMK